MNPKNDHFIAQYNQVWLQRRQHVTLIWAIPAGAMAVLTVLLNILFTARKSFSIEFDLILTLVIIFVGLWGLLLRHNFFIRTLGLLLLELDANPRPQLLPQFGDDLRNRYRSKLNLWQSIGSIKDGAFWWGIVFIGVFYLTLILMQNFVNSSMQITFDFLIGKIWLIPIIIVLLFVKDLCVFISSRRLKNCFKAVNGIIAILALIISVQTYEKSVVFGNRPIPKIILEADEQSGFLKFVISNRGKNPLTGVKIIYKFVPVQGDSPVEGKAKQGKVCLNLIEQGDDPVSFTTEYKISDLNPEVGYIFFFIGVQSESLYGKKYYFEDWYYLDSDKKYYSLKGNYCALGDGHGNLVRQQEKLLKKKLDEPLDKFCKN